MTEEAPQGMVPAPVATWENVGHWMPMLTHSTTQRMPQPLFQRDSVTGGAGGDVVWESAVGDALAIAQREREGPAGREEVAV